MLQEYYFISDIAFLCKALQNFIIYLRICFFATDAKFAQNAISPFFDASKNKNIGATIRIGREIQCLPDFFCKIHDFPL